MSDWTVTLRLSELGHESGPRLLQPDEAQRKAIAKSLDLIAVPALTGEVEATPWHDGAEIRGRWSARVTYSCGVTLEPFDADLEGAFTVRAVPPSSPLAESPSSPGSELELDIEAEDPPDVLDGETIDLAAYLVEDLALGLDPFPRKPGAVFEAPQAAEPESPFAVLKRLKE